MHSVTAVLALAALTASCGKSDSNAKPKDTPPTTGSAGTPPPAGGGLAITIDGVVQPGAAGFIKRKPDGSLQAYIGEGGTCAELLTNVFNGKKRHILVDIASQLAPDGTDAHAVTQVYVGGGDTAKPDGAASVTLRGTADAGAEATLDLELVGTGGGKAVAIKGSVPLAGCGNQDVAALPVTKAKHLSNALVTIATRTFPVMAALRRGKTIELYDFPRDCQSAYYIGVKLTYDSGTWTLSGARFASAIKGEGKGLTVTPGAGGTSADGPTVSLGLAGSDKVGDYAVAFDGTVEALDCK